MEKKNSGIANYTAIFFSLSLIALTFTRAGVFTGNVISETATRGIDTAVIVCLVGLVGSLVWRWKCGR